MADIFGGSGSETLNGTPSADRIYGFGGNDTLSDSSSGNDELYGGTGQDTLRITRSSGSAAGQFYLDGEDGNDTLILTSSGARTSDLITMIGGSGSDQFILGTGGSYTIYTGLDSDTIDIRTGATTKQGTVEDFTSGIGGDNILFNGQRVVQIGSDTLINGLLLKGVTAGFLDASNTGGSLIFRIDGTQSNDTLIGNAGRNEHYGFGGDDFIDGRGGNDHMLGGSGNDTYAVDAASDLISELQNEGTDTVYAGVNYSLNNNYFTSEVEFLFARDASVATNLQLIGNDFGQTIRGNLGDNFLNGAGGIDVMIGLAGNDTYVIDNFFDQVVEASGAGRDTIYTDSSYVLASGVEVEILSTRDISRDTSIQLTGNSYANTLYGDKGNNVLDGGGGADNLWGLSGNDIFVVDHAGDRVFESSGGGNDTLYTEVNYTLSSDAFVEALAARDFTSSNSLTLIGNQIANSIRGNAGTNFLDGGTGVDVLIGFGGNDTFVVDQFADEVFEDVGGGNDVVFASATYALASGAEIETLSSRDWSSTGALDLFGNAFSNGLYGNAGNNLLDGGAGVDLLAGLAGNDTYVVDDARDQVSEASGGGLDTVYASADYRLATGAYVEVLSTRDWAGTVEIDLTGNEIGNSLYGNADANRLDGGSGTDTLTGFGGSDTFAFTTALGGDNIDTVTDFEHAVDWIGLGRGAFAGLETVTATNLAIGAAAADADDRIVYNPATGAVLFDADGSGGNAGVLFAILDTGLTISASDFLLI